MQHVQKIRRLEIPVFRKLGSVENSVASRKPAENSAGLVMEQHVQKTRWLETPVFRKLGNVRKPGTLENSVQKTRQASLWNSTSRKPGSRKLCNVRVVENSVTLEGPAH
jgi:hypothetical protein